MNDMCTFFALISRMKYVDRWGLMHNERRENLMEHSFETAVIAGALANIENEMFGGCYDAAAVTMAALYHDASEIITGDMPTPVKYVNAGLKNAYKEVERDAERTLLSALPSSLRGSYEGYFQTDQDTRRLVKAADKISALIKCAEEVRSGNADFTSALKSTEQKVQAMELPSVRYFLEHIFPAYQLTLDELTNP